ncbi:unnamed protein product [Protopolystoma xenopodis]|uniref:Protein kinase domain-containing protein n=1 Tax=Protopolystoma xenopodis TaxID=117903 RepID=A0A448WYB1_9PLAT|nr:unnamed protein product [Protopolystoma xenopodis]
MQHLAWKRVKVSAPFTYEFYFYLLSCIQIRRQEKRLIGCPPPCSAKPVCSPTTEIKTGDNGVNAVAHNITSVDSPNKITLLSTHVFPSSAYDLLTRLLEPDPGLRISAIEALRHPFLRGYASSCRLNDGGDNSKRMCDGFSGRIGEIQAATCSSLASPAALGTQELIRNRLSPRRRLPPSQGDGAHADRQRTCTFYPRPGLD